MGVSFRAFVLAVAGHRTSRIETLFFVLVLNKEKEDDKRVCELKKVYANV